jgi:hypothetical protein
METDENEVCTFLRKCIGDSPAEIPARACYHHGLVLESHSLSPD